MRAYPASVPVAVAVAALTLVAGCSSGHKAPAASSPAPAVSALPTASPSPSLSPSATAGAPAASADLHAGTPKVLVTGLQVPWGLGFLPDGDALVTERMSARILRVTPEGKVTAVGTVAEVHAAGEGGLLGLVVSPHFASDHSIFVYYTSASDNRIVRLTVGADGKVDGSASGQHVLVSGIPSGQIHNGGRLAFGPDGMLYASTGETGNGGLAQHKSSLAGKILRMTPAGKPAPGNPFGTLVWSYGHRNVQGLAWDARGRMYATEFGQNTYDEINRIEPGKNYGWPTVEGVGHKAGFTDPLITWTPTSTSSPSGLAIAGGALWVAALRGAKLWRIPEAADGSIGTPKALFQREFGRLRTVVLAPGGHALWLMTSNRDGRGTPVAADDRIIVVPLK